MKSRSSVLSYGVFKKKKKKKTFLTLSCATLSPQSNGHFFLTRGITLNTKEQLFQISSLLLLPKLPFQQYNKSNTEEGIIQQTPNKPSNKRSQHLRAITQNRKRWAKLYPWLLHINNQSIIRAPCFLQLSLIEILPIALLRERNPFSSQCLVNSSSLESLEISKDPFVFFLICLPHL